MMAKFKYAFWLLEYLQSHVNFIFDWDAGNQYKSEEKHGVTEDIVESCFKDSNLIALGEQYEPLHPESRYGVLAKSSDGDLVFICFTLRGERIRPISARLANKRERKLYEEKVC
jgi:uncharacterized DUF497 family protein